MILAYIQEFDPEWKSELGLGDQTSASHYRFLSDITDDSGNVQTLSNDIEILMEDDADKFQCLIDALSVCNFSDDDQLHLWKMLVCVMKLGNIAFLENGDGKAEVDDMDVVEETAALMGCDPEDLADSLCSREFQNPTPGKEHEFIKFAATTAQAQQNRDAMAKSIYSGMFDNIVERVNQVFRDSELEGIAPQDEKFVSVLDIFGFEVLDHNSLEQLLINFTNEKLHDYFSRHMYADQIEMLKSETNLGGEGLSYFMDHVNEISTEQANRVKHLSDVVLGSCLDEISAHPKGQDSEFVALLRENPNPQFMSVQTPEEGGAFQIEHFAEAVQYTPEGFVDKNKFKLYSNLTKTITNCGNQYLQALIRTELQNTSQNMFQRFSGSLNSLIDLLDASAPRFVRCLKSNMLKAEWHFEPEIVHRQLIYASLLQTVRICTMGYPEQHPFSVFYCTYRPLFLGESQELRAFETSIGGIENADDVDDRKWIEGLEIFIQCVQNSLGKRIADLIKIGTSAVLLRDEASQALDVRKQYGVSKSCETIAAAVMAAMRSKEYNQFRASVSIQSVCRSLPKMPIWTQLRARIDINAACRAVLQSDRSWVGSGSGEVQGDAVPEPAAQSPGEVSAARERSNTATAKAQAALVLQEMAQEALDAAKAAGDDEAIETAEMELLEATSAVQDAEEEAAEAEEELEEELEHEEEDLGPKSLRVPSQYPTISEAIAAASDGDTVEIDPGHYAETLTVDKAISVQGTARIGVMITASAETAISVECPGQVKLSNLTIQITNAANNHNAVSVHSGSVTVQGCAFLGGFCGILVHHNSAADVRNSIIKNCSAGVVVDSSSHFEMEGCRCFSNKRCGVAILGEGSHGQISQSEIYDNEGFAVGVWRKAGLHMETCKVRGNEKGGVYVHGTGTSAEIERCEFGSDGSWQVAGKAKLAEKDNKVAPPDASKIRQMKSTAEIVSGNAKLEPVDTKTMTTATGRKILRIYLSDGTHNALAVEPSTTARDVCQMVAAKKLWLKEDSAKNTQLIDGLALYETSSVPVNYRRRLLDEECPVEVMQNWASGRSHKFVLNTKRKGKELKGKQQIVRVYIVDGTHISLSVPQQCTVRETCKLLADKRSGDGEESNTTNPLWDTFTLYEVNYAQDGSSSSWRSLGVDETLQDVISSSPKGVSSLFLYKKRVFLRQEDYSDAGYLHITYLQVITALRSRLFGSPAKPFNDTLSDPDLVQMAALHLYYMLGPSQAGSSSTLSLLWRTMQSCVPSGVWKAYSPGATRACEEYAEIKLASQQDAARELIRIAQKYPHFGREFFPVRGQNPPVAIGVGFDGMLVVHAVTRAPIRTYPLSDMKEWNAVTDQTVTTHLEFSAEGEKVSFITPDAYEIVLLLECYAKM
eukprot:TRINITY_DN5268_c0_g2_i5.p1 TRINITY_DN5268_c0_g2~~TRINITY_DN5268_c0_g2_i5.p1  ORF type:complete len:1387 (-),score=435.96 TRINITY_DN5268_c0_g2_i5:260-4420(-)